MQRNCRVRFRVVKLSMAEVIIRKRKGERGKGADTDVNQNKTKTTKLNMKELAKEKIRQQMEGPPVKDKSKKSKKAEVSKAPTKAAPLTKGKNYKSSVNRDLKEKDPNSKDVLIKKYVRDTKAGGRSKRGELKEYKNYSMNFA